MKHRYWLFRRRQIYYIQDKQTGQRTSLHTSDKIEAARLRDAGNQAAQQPTLNMALGKAYLSFIDPVMLLRTWAAVMDEYCSIGKESTRTRRRRALQSPVFKKLRKKILIETIAEDFYAILKKSGAFNSDILRHLQTLALGLGWIPQHIIPPKRWPKHAEKDSRAITEEEHLKILAAEQNPERRLYYQLLWEIGASQSDAAQLTAANIDWETRRLTYVRGKTGTPARLKIGCALETILRQLPGEGFLFPKQASLNACYRAAEFSRRTRLLEITGISLHSYRYAWAHRAKKRGYPERFAQEALGHASAAVHREYAKGAEVEIPPLEDFEPATPIAPSTASLPSADAHPNVIALNFAPATAPTGPSNSPDSEIKDENIVTGGRSPQRVSVMLARAELPS